jgi:hypothetical protein
MKHLFKLSIVLFLLSFETETFAQNFGIKAGLNLSNMIMKNDEYNFSEDYKMKTGFHFGPTVEFPINEMFSFESALLLSTKGTMIANERETYDAYVYKKKINMFYLDIPISAKAAFKIGSFKIYGSFGPYAGIGLNAKIKTKLTTDGNTETNKENISFGSDEDEFKRLDYGLAAGGGIEFKEIQFGITYGLGLANISSSTENGGKINNRVLSFSFGYKFGEN